MAILEMIKNSNTNLLINLNTQTLNLHLLFNKNKAFPSGYLISICKMDLLFVLFVSVDLLS